MNEVKFNEAATVFEADMNVSGQTFEAELNASEQTFATDFRTVKEINVGPQGEPGASAFDIAVECGFDGTVEEWLASLNGGKGDKGDPFTYDDFTAEQLANLKGDPGYTPVKGKDYTDGKDGVSATHSWNGTTLTVTSASGTSSADLKGEPGYTPQKGIDYFDGASGIYVGADTPPDTAAVWVDPNSKPTSTEVWTFTLEDGTTVPKTVIVVS